MIRAARSMTCAIAVALVAAAAGVRAQSAFVRTVEDVEHVTVMEFSGIYDRQPPENIAGEFEIRRQVAREFLRTHADDYDFLVVFTRFPYDLGSDVDGAQVKGLYRAVKNDVRGIGQDIFDDSAAWGSSGRLQGYIDMGTLGQVASDPTDANFETTLSTLAHEFEHRWGAHVKVRAPDGSIDTRLLGRDKAHWSFLLQSYNSVLYGQDWRDNGDGTFTSIGRSRSD